MSDKNLSWEEAVEWLKSQPEQQNLVKACYYDEPLIGAAQRFESSEEWKAIHQLLENWLPGSVLDLGAGNGIASYAFSKAGCKVTALEPDPSNKVGGGAIKKLSAEVDIPITVVEAFGETLPFESNQFDIVHCRQVLHHANDLSQLCQEVSRVLKPGGVLIATREHVISKASDMDNFLRSHPLHHLYGGENAFLLNQYCESISKADLKIEKIYGPYDSAINYCPVTQDQLSENIIKKLKKYVGENISTWVVSQSRLRHLIFRYLSIRDQTAGRLYSFIATKTKQ